MSVTIEQEGPMHELPEDAPEELRLAWEGLSQVDDPEMPISIVDLGLVYGMKLDEDTVHVTITFTYTGCPGRSYIKDDVRNAVLENTSETIQNVEIHTTYTPEWEYDMISEAGQEELQEFGISVPDYDAT